MKKLIAGLVAAFMMSVGLVAFSGVPSEAGHAKKAIATKTVIKGPKGIHAHRRPNLLVGVKAPGRPRGKVELVVKKVRGSFSRTATYRYKGYTKALLGPTLHERGLYRVTVNFYDPSGTYASSSDSMRVIVDEHTSLPDPAPALLLI